MEGIIAVGTRISAGDVVAQVDPSKPGSRFEPSPVRSPASGTVTAVFVESGHNVTTSTAVAEIASLDELDVVVSVPERYAPNVTVGSRAEARLSSLGNRSFETTARSADPVLDSSTRSKRVFFRLPGGIRGVQPGMFAEVSITLSRSASALIVPVDAVVRREGRDAVYVVRDGIAVERTVSIGLFAEEGVEILSGLEEGELAIVQGQNLIRDGSKVNVMEGR
jgi:RND family efflux transporter MFP subunit